MPANPRSAAPPPTPPSASLDPTETPVRKPPFSPHPADEPPGPPPTAADLHAPHQRYRDNVAASLARLQPNSPRLHRYWDCAANWWIMQSTKDPTNFKFIRAFCHDRFCPTCAAKRSATIRRNLAAAIQPADHRFLTLTLRSTATPLRQQVDRLLASFRRLRAQPWWPRYTRGGCAFFELTYNEHTALWHPHLHVILEGNYLPHQTIRAAWLKITRDSDVVHIRQAHDLDSVIRYVANYSTKALPPPVTRNPDALDAAITALRSRKTCYTFGTWNTYHLLRHEPDPDWTCLGSLDRPRGAAHYDPVLLHTLAEALEAHLAGLAPPTATISTDYLQPATPTQRPPPADSHDPQHESPTLFPHAR